MDEDPQDRGPEVVEDLALGAFRMVKEKLAFELDFTPETLPVLDHYLRELRGADEKVLSVVAPCAGAYFGEVLRRSLPGLRWGGTSGEYSSWRIEAGHVFMCLHPIGMVLEGLYGEAVDGHPSHLAILPGDRDAVDRSLASAGGVREDDFSRLAIRHEVIEQTLSVLEELARQRGEHRTFGADVYDVALGTAEPGIDA
jgi:hypothetical protein